MMRLTVLIVAVLYCIGDCRAAANVPVDHKSKECPEGFVLKGKTCEAVVVHSPQYVCPRGTVSVEGQCLTFVPPRVECPYGFTLSGKSCSQVQTAPVQFYCTEGELHGSACKHVIPQAPVCPAGYSMDGNACVRFAPVLKKCPSGYSQSGKECTKKVSFPASPSCPAGMELNAAGVKCFRFEERQPFCAAGFQLSGVGQCLKYVSKVPVACPHGYAAVGNECETVEKHPVDLLCPADMQLDATSETCVKEIPVPPRCPAGFAASQAGQCERFLSSRSVCPHDTVPATAGQCKRKLVSQKYPKCAPGFELVGEKCKKVDEFPVKTVCKFGRQVGDQCVTTESTSPQYACPEDFELSKTSKGPQCTRTVQYDCSTTVMQKECDMPDFVDHLTSNRKLKGEYAPVTVAVPAVHHGKQPKCRQVPVQVPKTCSKQETAPVKYVCTEGSLMGKNCQVQHYSPAMQVCTAGDMDAATGRCLKISITAASWHCASGNDAGGMTCVEYELVPADYVCPEGTEGIADYKALKCVERKPEIVFPNKIVKQPAKIACSIGSLKGRACVQYIRVPREFECPAGSSTVGNMGKCAVASELIQPPPVEVATPPKFVCPNGQSAPQRLCFTIEGTAIEEYCPHSMAFTEGKCVAAVEMIQPAPVVKSTPATPTCPEGFSLHGSVCKASQVVPAEKSCQSGYLMHFQHGKEVCAKSHDLQAVCPPGTAQTPEGCISRKHAPPQVTIVRTCTKGQPGCH